jgi:hypothetical protein
MAGNVGSSVALASIEEDRHGRDVEETSGAQPRLPGNRREGADGQLEGEEAEEEVAREVARSGASGRQRAQRCRATWGAPRGLPSPQVFTRSVSCSLVLVWAALEQTVVEGCAREVLKTVFRDQDLLLQLHALGSPDCSGVRLDA